MFDKTQEKIISSTMNLIMQKGYSATTTKDIAKHAGVNECTIFRKFQNKKDIVLSAMQLPDWNPSLSEQDFSYCGMLEQDLYSFAEVYLNKVTPQMVKISIGLRTPELYDATAPGIMQVPQTFKTVLVRYFRWMQERGALRELDVESAAMMFLSMCFGFVFLDASFGSSLTQLSKTEYIQNSVNTFVNGIQ
ncbi:MAG: TetR/AcrR family transcriptional regulator [Butyricicoccus sp.]